MTNSKIILHKKIKEFIKHYNFYIGYYYFYQIKLNDEEYNKIISSFFVIYLNKLFNIKKEKKIKKLKEAEPRFLELLINILKYNYNNIRFNFTMELIKQIDNNKINDIIIYLTKYGFIFYLEIINSKKLELDCLYQIKNAEYIYSALIEYYKKMELRWSWLAAVAQIRID